VGVGKKTGRKRAVGTREHIIAYLTEVNELFDANGMASTQLAAAVGYPGSSVAFAQLLSGMERSGLIEREVRGKRTYRIRLGPANAVGEAGAFRGSGVPGFTAASGLAGASRIPEGPGVSGGSRVSGGLGVSGGPRGSGRSGTDEAPGAGGGAGVGAGAGAAGFDYDELARRLLVQLVRQLAAAEPEASHPDRSELQETVTGLESELATAWTKHAKLAEENVRLREQLRAAQRSLALAAERLRGLPASPDLDSSEVVLLQRLLTAEDADSPDDSAAESREGLGQARSVLS
jgi:hypothetical protein